MGVGCSNACTSSRDGDRTDGVPSTRTKGPATVENWKNQYEISLVCHSLPSSRILSHPTDLLGPGAGCRSVAVITITVTKRGDARPSKKESKFNSAIYTPVIQWSGVNVKQQVPKYLPMNLWPGSYTMFAFYNQEEQGPMSVKLTAKVGSAELCVQEEVETAKYKSDDDCSHLSELMEKELAKLLTPVKKPSYDPIPEKEETPMTTKTRQQRVSEDTGYMSTKPSFDHSPYAIRRVCNSPDSDVESAKEKQLSEKKLKFRRKDTPAHGLHQVKRSQQSFAIFPLEEESGTNTPTGAGLDSLEISNLLRPTTSLSTYDLSSVSPLDSDSSLQPSGTRVELSRSYCDLRETESASTMIMSSHSDDGRYRASTQRRKKKSIINKIAACSQQSLLGSAEAIEKETDKDADADDEADVDNVEHDKLNASITLDNKSVMDFSKKEDEKIVKTDTLIVVEKECTTVPNRSDIIPKHNRNDVQTTTDADKQPSDEKGIKNVADTKKLKNKDIRKFSYSKFIEPQMSFPKDEDTHPYADNEMDIANVSELFEETAAEQQKGQHTETEINQSVKSVKQQNEGEFEPTKPRARSRTLSKRYVFEDKGQRERLTRHSNSISVSSESRTPKREVKKKVQPLVISSNKNNSIPEPPVTPKEAFSDS